MGYLCRLYVKAFKGWLYCYYYSNCSFHLYRDLNDYQRICCVRLGWLEFGFSSLPY